ncbi:hypothetical protein [Microbacterium sp. NPDC089696]|uniref:hypothetical protein n=1 Tax=Microbacterium sp. NPDC089696 TaxID=3364199 RepID=UPI003816181C
MTITHPTRRRDAQHMRARAGDITRTSWVLEGTADEQAAQMMELMALRPRVADRAAAQQSRRRRIQALLLFGTGIVFAVSLGWIALKGGVLAGTEVDGSAGATTFNLILFGILGITATAVAALSLYNLIRQRQLEDALNAARERAYHEARSIAARRALAASHEAAASTRRDRLSSQPLASTSRDELAS